MPTIYEAGGQAMRSTVTRRKCAQVADRVAAAIRAAAAAERLDVTVERSDGTRPKGRPFARITVRGDDEWGASGTPKRRIMARATSAAARTGRR